LTNPVTLTPTQFVSPGVLANKTTGTEGTNSDEAREAVSVTEVNGCAVVISTAALVLLANRRRALSYYQACAPYLGAMHPI
jgi:hypothetical protein